MLHFRNAVTYICPYCITGTKQTKTDKNIFKITTAIKVTKKNKKVEATTTTTMNRIQTATTAQSTSLVPESARTTLQM